VADRLGLNAAFAGASTPGDLAPGGPAVLTFYGDHTYDPDDNVVNFPAQGGGQRINCRLSLDALQRHVGLESSDMNAVLHAFNEARDAAEEIAIHKYENGQIEPDGSVVVRATDF
jgi:hypothetical protein